MTEDVGITGAGEGVEDTTVVEVDVGVTTDQALEGTTVDELTLGHPGTIACSASRHTGIMLVSTEIDIGAISLIVRILAIFAFFANSTSLAATEDLEGVTLVQVDGGAAPYF